ncbi:MAG: hypothetical protein AAF986_10105, partial [Pseudomonadota bacterium]
MPTKTVSVLCDGCGEGEPAKKTATLKTTSVLVHILLFFLTLGLWSVVWVFLVWRRRAACNFCGEKVTLDGSDRFPSLIVPGLFVALWISIVATSPSVEEREVTQA